MLNWIRQWKSHSFVKFLLVGVLNTLLGLSLMFFLYNVFDMSYWLSTFLGNSAGAVLSFVLNRSFTFRSGVPWLSGMIKFATVTLVCYVLAFGGSMALVKQLAQWLLQGQHEQLVTNLSILAGNGFYTLLNYAGHRWFTFRERADELKDMVPMGD